MDPLLLLALSQDLEVPTNQPEAPGSGVVGGADANAADWPGIAAVYLDREVGCTGVLVAPTVVLTAGHCADGITGVSLGASDIGGLRQQYKAERVVAYPKWLQTYDAAIIILDRPADIAPVEIAQGCVLDHWYANGSKVDVVGYGAIDKRARDYVDELQAGTTVVIDAHCEDEALGCNPQVSPAGELAAGGNGVDSCNGDSGGPLYLRTPQGPYLVGITSRAVDTARLPCSEGGIYVRSDALVDWIEATAGIELPEPECDAAAIAEAVEDAADAADDTITSMSYEVGVCGLPGGAPSLLLGAIGAALAMRRRRG